MNKEIKIIADPCFVESLDQCLSMVKEHNLYDNGNN